jgi:hypothetical protein
VELKTNSSLVNSDFSGTLTHRKNELILDTEADTKGWVVSVMSKYSRMERTREKMWLLLLLLEVEQLMLTFLMIGPMVGRPTRLRTLRRGARSQSGAFHLQLYVVAFQ